MNALIPRYDLPTKPVETSTITITQCGCGAITIDAEDCSNSMTEEIFLKEFPNLEVPEETMCGSCNHCVNHWGIDLCGCGSGETVGECDNEYAECRKKEPSQIKMELM